jgi:hypothetical protein
MGTLVPAGIGLAIFALFCGNGNADQHLGASFSVYKGIRSAVKRVELVSDRMSLVHNTEIVHTPDEDKIRDRFYEELVQSPKYHMNIL